MSQTDIAGARAAHGVTLAGRVAVVSGAGRGIGAEIARELARRGARVVVNDLGVSVEGHPENDAVAESLVAKIREDSGEAVAHVGDAASYEDAGDAVALALERWDRLDIVVNNAGTLRVKPIWEMAAEDWDSVLRSHLRHTYALTHHACRYWKAEAEAGRHPDARIVNLTAATGLVGRPDMGSNHAAAKGAIAAFTLVVADEMFRYGVTSNAISPAACRTRMATHVNAQLPEPDGRLDIADPKNVAPLAAYLASAESHWITGQVFRVIGATIGWHRPWSLAETIAKNEPWSADELVVGVRKLFGLYPGSAARR